MQMGLYTYTNDIFCDGVDSIASLAVGALAKPKKELFLICWAPQLRCEDDPKRHSHATAVFARKSRRTRSLCYPTPGFLGPPFRLASPLPLLPSSYIKALRLRHCARMSVLTKPFLWPSTTSASFNRHSSYLWFLSSPLLTSHHQDISEWRPTERPLFHYWNLHKIQGRELEESQLPPLHVRTTTLLCEIRRPRNSMAWSRNSKYSKSQPSKHVLPT